MWYLMMNSITIDRKLENKPFIAPGTHSCVDDIIEVIIFTTIDKPQNRLKLSVSEIGFPVEPVTCRANRTHVICLFSESHTVCIK